MSGVLVEKFFSEIDLRDPFFDSLKKDYPGTESSTRFSEWFDKKSKSGSKALVYEDDTGIGAFLCCKCETEEITLAGGQKLPAIERLKISTIKISEKFHGQRIGEGALGLALWKWQNSGKKEVYVTVFEKHKNLIFLLERFGFLFVGLNQNGERVYIKSRENIDYTDIYKSFPFVNPAFDKAGYLIIDDNYHDTMFPYSELKNTFPKSLNKNVANGLSKIYIGQCQRPFYSKGTPIFIYRRHTGDGIKKYKSCITSLCVVADVFVAKEYGRCLMSLNDLLSKIKNKSVFDPEEISRKYNSFKRMVVIEMLYLNFFGAGNNVNYDWLTKNNCWPTDKSYPTTYELSKSQFLKILSEGKINVKNVIIN